MIFTVDQGFVVHKADSTTQVFKPSKKGLFFTNVKKDVEQTGHILKTQELRIKLNTLLKSTLMMYMLVLFKT